MSRTVHTVTEKRAKCYLRALRCNNFKRSFDIETADMREHVDKASTFRRLKHRHKR